MSATRNEAVRVRGVSYREGFSGFDHFLSNSDFSEVVGRIFPSRRTAREACKALATHGEGRCPTTPISIDLAPAVEPPSEREVLDALERDGWISPQYPHPDFELYRSEGYWWARHASGPKAKIR